MEVNGSIAHELITRGWVQDAFERDDGSLCLVSAASRAATGAPWGDALVPRRVLTVLAQTTKRSTRGTVSAVAARIMKWNDNPDRTYDEVLRAAKTADEILGAQ